MHMRTVESGSARCIQVECGGFKGSAVHSGVLSHACEYGGFRCRAVDSGAKWWTQDVVICVCVR
jgi:hypothetical protein